MTQARARGPKYQARRQDIVDTAARLFARNGYAETGIAEIGEAVDLARGALYYYIGSKEALLAEIHDRVLDPLLERSKLIMKLNASPAVKVRLISEVLLAQIIERQDHVWVFLPRVPSAHRTATQDIPRQAGTVRTAPGRPLRRGHGRRGVRDRRPRNHNTGVSRHAQLHVPVDPQPQDHAGSTLRVLLLPVLSGHLGGP